MMLVFFRLLRMKQWLKNLMLFFPPLLAGGNFSLNVWSDGFLGFVVFCLFSSASYIINDLRDAESDRHHPVKCHRPLASGRVSAASAKVMAGFSLSAGCLIASLLPAGFWVFMWAYLLLSLLYTFYLKNQPILDICVIALLFVFRLYAGGSIFTVQISPWLFLSVFLLALYLSAGKRLSEVKTLEKTASAHRQSLAGYPAGVLDGILVVTGAASLVTYSLYAISRGVLIYSVPICVFGLFRYLSRVKSGSDGDPTISLLADIPLLMTGVVWSVMVIWSVHQ